MTDEIPKIVVGRIRLRKKSRETSREEDRAYKNDFVKKGAR